MLQNIKTLHGHKLAASDGAIGQVKDFYFDDKTWVVRYLVVDTGSWLPGRLVLLSPHAFGRWDAEEKMLHVNLTRKQIEDSPSIDAHKPVSRQYEVDYYRYYGWPTYWEGSGMWGMGGYPVVMPPPKAELVEAQKHHHRADKHLRSTHAVSGYQIQATDAEIGSVSSFLVDDKSWAIRALVVEAGHWYSGKEILLSPLKVDRISYEESKVFVNVTKADIERTLENHLVHTGEGKDSRADFPTD